MGSLYEEAIRRAGSDERLCDKCKDLAACYSSTFGVRTHSESKGLSCPNVSIPLVDAIADSDYCWHCGWLASIVTETWFDHLSEDVMTPDSHLTKANVSWHSITMSDKDSRKIEGASTINRIAFSYGTNYEEFEQRKVTFSKCVREPANLSSLLDHTEALDWPVNEPYAGRIRPGDIDHRLLKRWKECCLRDHSGTCDQTFMTHHTQSLRFVDIFERRIVRLAPETVSWAALSYCWGGPQECALKTSNLLHYQRRGSLQRALLPQGIADAMTVSWALGLRYLWVDSLCIIQDDDRDKLEFIAAMGTIYAHAAVTVVNAANEHVAVGMPGISRTRQTQQIHRMKNFWLVEALDLPHRYFDGYLHNCTWNTRGWTFQEGLLSPRCLIIGKDQVYWQCKTASWCEDSSWENIPSQNIYRHYSGSNILNRLTDAREEDWMELYKDVLNTYEKRLLTSESDRLGAVQAILQVLRRDDEANYFWGMPQGHMEMALSWSSSSRNTRRDCDAKFMGVHGEVMSSPFPSWSWLGWHGPSPMPSVNRALLGGRLGLQFYSIQSDGTPSALNENPFVGPERDFSRKDYMKTEDLHEQIGYPRNLPHISFNFDKRVVRPSDVPGHILSSRKAQSVLCFWTSTAVLEMKYEGQNNFHRCPLIALSHGDIRFYSAWEHNLEFKPNGTGKFIIIGTERTRMSHGGDVTVNLLLVDEDENGISYRRKLVTYTPESVWDKLDNRKWELVFLA